MPESNAARGRLSSQRARLNSSRSQTCKAAKGAKSASWAQRVFESDVSERENCLLEDYKQSQPKIKGLSPTAQGREKNPGPAPRQKEQRAPGKPKRMLRRADPAQISATAHHHFEKSRIEKALA